MRSSGVISVRHLLPSALGIIAPAQFGTLFPVAAEAPFCMPRR